MAKRLRVWVEDGEVRKGRLRLYADRTRMKLTLGSRPWNNLEEVVAWGWEGSKFVVHVRAR